MVCENEYMYDTMDNIEYQYIKSSLLKHIKWQLKCAAYDMNTFNEYKQVLHKRRYKKLMRNIHDLKELHEKINEDKPIDIMYFTTYRGAMSSMDSNHDTCCYLSGCSRYFLHNVAFYNVTDSVTYDMRK